MAKSGRIMATSSYAWIELTWEVQSSSAVTNTSTIYWELVFHSLLPSNYSDKTLSCSATVNGVTRAGSFAGGDYPTGAYVLISDTQVVNHDVWGSATIDLSCWINGKPFATWEKMEASGTGTLDNIERQAKIDYVYLWDDETDPTVYYTNPLEDSAYYLQLCIKTKDGTVIADYRDIPKNGYAYTLTLTDAERKLLRQNIKSASESFNFHLVSNWAGITAEDVKSGTCYLINYEPTLDPIVVDSNTVTTELTKDMFVLVKGHSYVFAIPQANARKEATLASGTIIHGSQVYEHDGYSNQIFSVAESPTTEFSVTDSRGFTTRANVESPFVDYVPLTSVLKMGIFSGDGTVEFTVEGKYFDDYFGDPNIAQHNTMSCRYRITDRLGNPVINIGNDGWVDLGVITPTTDEYNNYSFTYLITGLDHEQQYNLYVCVHDKLTSELTSTTVIQAIPVFDWSREDFNFNVPVNFAKGFTQPNSALKQLWNGQSKMESSSTSISLIETVSSQPNGIVLVFTPFDTSTNLANDEKLMSFFVSKKTVQVMARKLHTFMLLEGANFSGIGAKSLYIADDKISGYANNVASGTANGITYNNNKYVLRWILGV